MRATDERDIQLAELEKAYYAIQEVLAFVLQEIGEPIEITKEQIAKGLPENVTIDINDDIARDMFVFSLKEIDD